MKLREKNLTPRPPSRVGMGGGGLGCCLLLDPRPPIRPPQKLVRFVVADHLLPVGIPRQRPAELHRQVRENATGSRYVRLLDVGDRLAASVDCLPQEIQLRCRQWLADPANGSASGSSLSSGNLSFSINGLPLIVAVFLPAGMNS